MFISDAKLFLSANTKLDNAKTIINECKRLVSEIELPNEYNYINCKNNINGCDIDGLVDIVTTTKQSLMKLDQDFSNEYMTLLQNHLQTISIDRTDISEEEKMQYSAISKDYNNTILCMLEEYEKSGMLVPEMQIQLNIQRKLKKQYDIQDKMSVLSPTSQEYIDLFKKNADIDRELINLNSNLSEEEKSSYLKKYEDSFNSTLEVLELNRDITKKNDELKELEAGSVAYYEKENEIRQIQINYYERKGNLTEQEQKQLGFLKNGIELNELYIDKEQNNGFWHPIIEGEYDEAILDKKIEMGIATEDEIAYDKMNDFDRACENTKTFLTSVVFAVGSVTETLVDGGVLIAGEVGSWFGADTQWAEDFTSIHYADDAYAGLVQSGYINSVSAYSGWHTAGNMVGTAVGYVALSCLPGGPIVTGIAGGLSAMGSSSQRALDSGATFHEAFGTGAVSGIFGFVSGWAVGKLGALAQESTTLMQVGGYTLAGMGVSTLEPIVNSVAEYAIYANDMVDENGNKVYDNIWNYYVDGGGLTNTVMAGVFGAISVGSKSLQGYSTNKYKAKFNKNMDLMTESERSKAWEDYYTQTYGADKVEHISGVDIEGNNGSYNVNSMTESKRSKVWKDYYTQTYGADKVEHISGVDIEGSNGSYILDGVDRYNSELVLHNIKTMQKNKYKFTYEATTESAKDYAHYLSTSQSFDELDINIDKYHSDNMKAVLEYDSWKIAKTNLEMGNPNFGNLSRKDQESLIKNEVHKMVKKVNNSTGTTIREKLINSGCYEPDQIDVILTDATKNNYNAAINGAYALKGVDGAPRAYASIENYYLDMANKSFGKLSAHVTPEYRLYVLKKFANANGTNRVSAIYANDNLKFAINIPGAKDSDILQLSMWNKASEIEVDMSNKSFGRLGDRQFVSPPSDSDKLFNNITKSQETINTQEIVGAATGLPTSGNDRLTRISLNTEGDVQLHKGNEKGSCKEALSGGLPAYEIDGKVYKMSEGTIESLDLSKVTDWNKVDFTIDNFSPETGELISTYKLKEIDGKTYLILQGG